MQVTSSAESYLQKLNELRRAKEKLAEIKRDVEQLEAKCENLREQFLETYSNTTPPAKHGRVGNPPKNKRNRKRRKKLQTNTEHSEQDSLPLSILSNEEAVDLLGLGHDSTGECHQRRPNMEHALPQNNGKTEEDVERSLRARDQKRTDSITSVRRLDGEQVIQGSHGQLSEGALLCDAGCDCGVFPCISGSQVPIHWENLRQNPNEIYSPIINPNVCDEYQDHSLGSIYPITYNFPY